MLVTLDVLKEDKSNDSNEGQTENMSSISVALVVSRYFSPSMVFRLVRPANIYEVVSALLILPSILNFVHSRCSLQGQVMCPYSLSGSLCLYGR